MLVAKFSLLAAIIGLAGAMPMKDGKPDPCTQTPKPCSFDQICSFQKGMTVCLPNPEGNEE